MPDIRSIQALSPSNLELFRGESVGDLSDLTVGNQVGTDLVTATTVQLLPGDFGFSGVFAFEGVTDFIAEQDSFVAAHSYYGPASGTALWTFEAYDFDAGDWVSLNTNADNNVAANTWARIALVFPGTQNRYVSGGGYVLIRFATEDTDPANAIYLDQMGLEHFRRANNDLTDTWFNGQWTSGTAENTFVASHSIVITNSGQTKVAALKVTSPTIKVYWYQKIAGAGVGDTQGLYDFINTNNYFWRDDLGNAIYNPTNGWFFVNMQDAAIRAAWTAKLLEVLAADTTPGGTVPPNYDGVFLDDTVVLDPAFPDLVSATPADYDINEHYNGLFECMSAVSALSFPDEAIFNNYQGASPAGFRGTELQAAASGQLFEGYAFRVNGNFFDLERLEQQIQAAAQTGVVAKQFLSLDYGLSTDLQRRMYSRAVYMLAAYYSSKTFQQFKATDITGTNADLQDYPEYHIEIGAPIGNYYNTGTFLRREFYGGTVIVNHSHTTAYDYTPDVLQDYLTISGGGSYPIPSGSSAWVQISGSVSVAADTALICRNRP